MGILDIKHHRLKQNVVFSEVFSRTHLVYLVYILILLVLLVILLGWRRFKTTVFMQIIWGSRLNLYFLLEGLEGLLVPLGDEAIALDPWGDAELACLDVGLLAHGLLTLHVQNERVLYAVEPLEQMLGLCG